MVEGERVGVFKSHCCFFFLFCFLNAVIKAGGDISMLLIKGNQLVWKSKGKKCLKDHPPTQMQSQVVSLE